MSDSLRLARPPTLTQLAASKLRDAIFSGQFQPGQRLVELELSDRFGVSRAPLREAFRILAAEGLVDMRQNRGCYVVNPSAEALEQMVFFRALIEGSAAGLITARRDPAKLERIESAYRQMIIASTISDNKPFIDAHWLLHSSIIASSENINLVNSWNTIGSIFRIFMSKTFIKLGDRKVTLNDIEGFLRLFRTGSPPQAEAVVRSVILWSGFRLLETTIPNEVASYVTHLIGPGAVVTTIDTDHLAGRLRAPRAAVTLLPDATVERPEKRQKPSLKRAV